ncbi:hypothetical protein HispidOSU_022748, partial [Sigmodon hispidus]
VILPSPVLKVDLGREVTLNNILLRKLGKLTLLLVIMPEDTCENTLPLTAEFRKNIPQGTCCPCRVPPIHYSP